MYSADFELLLRVGEVFGIIVTIWGVAYSLARYMKRERVYFPKNNADFYQYYSKQLAKSKKEILMTSDGFNMENPTSKHSSEVILEGIRIAIQSGACLKRFQITETMNLNWLHELKKHKSEFGELYKIYVNENLTNVPNICVIDADAGECITESMEQTERSYGQGSTAVSYHFRYRDKDDAERKKGIFDELLAARSTRELELCDIDQLNEELFRKRLEKLKEWWGIHKTIDGSPTFDKEVIDTFFRDGRD